MIKRLATKRHELLSALHRGDDVAAELSALASDYRSLGMIHNATSIEAKLKRIEVQS